MFGALLLTALIASLIIAVFVLIRNVMDMEARLAIMVERRREDRGQIGELSSRLDGVTLPEGYSWNRTSIASTGYVDDSMEPLRMLLAHLGLQYKPATNASIPATIQKVKRTKSKGSR